MAFTVVFPADRDSPVTDIDAFIPVVDDEINERDSQLFLVFIEVINATNFTLLENKDQNISLCHILDDDCKFT